MKERSRRKWHPKRPGEESFKEEGSSTVLNNAEKLSKINQGKGPVDLATWRSLVNWIEGD